MISFEDVVCIQSRIDRSKTTLSVVVRTSNPMNVIMDGQLIHETIKCNHDEISDIIEYVNPGSCSQKNKDVIQKAIDIINNKLMAFVCHELSSMTDSELYGLFDSEIIRRVHGS